MHLVGSFIRSTEATLQKVVNYVVHKWDKNVHIVPCGCVVSVTCASSGNDRILDLRILHANSLCLRCRVPFLNNLKL
jgi:hypothetical protein